MPNIKKWSPLIPSSLPRLGHTFLCHNFWPPGLVHALLNRAIGSFPNDLIEFLVGGWACWNNSKSIRQKRNHPHLLFHLVAVFLGIWKVGCPISGGNFLAFILKIPMVKCRSVVKPIPVFKRIQGSSFPRLDAAKAPMEKPPALTESLALACWEFEKISWKKKWEIRVCFVKSEIYFCFVGSIFKNRYQYTILCIYNRFLSVILT